MEVATAEQLLTALEKSNLLGPEQLARAKSIAAQNNDAQAIARALLRERLLTRWQAVQLLLGRKSFFVGKYKLMDLLGRGGMGSVFLGQHVTMNRRVALKIISRELCRDPAARERFLSEARAVAALDHPNIVQAYSVDNEGDQYYLVMEYVDGRDLQQIVDDDGPLDYSVAADAVRQAAEGLAHAHQRNMIHCDIKPSNLLVNNQGAVKILDMGLARLTGESGRPGASDEHMKGTVDYMAPEQGLGVHFDHRADIYALGCTFYFLLTGHPPFPEGTIAQRIIRHQTQQPQGILEQRPDAPRDLVKICRKMMAKEPDERYASAEEVARALAQWKPTQLILKRAVPLDAVESKPSDRPAEQNDALAEIAAMDFSLDGPRTRSPLGRARSAQGKTSSGKQQMLLIGAAIFGVVLLLVGTIVAVVALQAKIAREDAAASMTTNETRPVKDKGGNYLGSPFKVNQPEPHSAQPKGAPVGPAASKPGATKPVANKPNAAANAK